MIRPIPVYIIHPFRGDGSPGNYETNRQAVKEICRQIAFEDSSYVPVSPILLFDFLDDAVGSERRHALKLCRELLRLVINMGGEVRAYGEYRSSWGCLLEILWAQLDFDATVWREDSFGRAEIPEVDKP